MNVKCLGTGAADFLPTLKTTDRFTVNKNVRRSTSTLIDEALLIDCGPHVADAVSLFGVAVEKIEALLLTHPHSDHWNVDVVASIAAQLPHPLHLWYHEQVSMPDIPNTVKHPMRIREEYDVCGYAVTPLVANHDVIGCVHYSIEKDGKKLFYGADGAWLLSDTYGYMRGRLYDAIILDATVGDYVGDLRMASHNSIPMIRLMVPSFLTDKIANEQTKIVMTHLARTLHKPHDVICEQVAADGYIVAFDGMELSI